MPNEILGKRAYTTTEIGQILGFHLSAKFIEETLGIPADEKNRLSNLWLASSVRLIFYEICQYGACLHADSKEILEAHDAK